MDTSPRVATRLLGIRVLNAFVALLVIGLLVGYLGLTTQSAAKGFIIRQIEQKLTALHNEGQRLEVEVSMKQALQNVSGEVDKYGFVPVAGIQYVNQPGGAVAVK